MSTVYLSGPITGQTFVGATSWREYAREILGRDGIEGLSPMRSKDYLQRLDAPISGHGREYVNMGVLSTPAAVVTRDRFDTQRSDVMLMNLLGADKISIGTMIEIGWADVARVPIIAVVEANGNIHDHMMVNQLIGFRVETLDEGLHVAKAILLPGVKSIY